MKDCFPSVHDIVENGQKRPQKGFEVILEDTILFPEGGGQVQFLFFITINNWLCLLRIFVIYRPEIPSIGFRRRKFSSVQSFSKLYLITMVHFSWKSTHDGNIFTDKIYI